MPHVHTHWGKEGEERRCSPARHPPWQQQQQQRAARLAARRRRSAAAAERRSNSLQASPRRGLGSSRSSSTAAGRSGMEVIQVRTRARPHREVKREENNSSAHVPTWIADAGRWRLGEVPGGEVELRRDVWMCGGYRAQRRTGAEWRERRFSGESWGVFLEGGGREQMRKDAETSFFLAVETALFRTISRKNIYK